jgi:aminomethyltransferase
MCHTENQETTSPLIEFENELGARWAPFRGVELPTDYGDPAAEYSALRHASGLFDRRGVELVEMTGADRHRFLNAYVTCDVKELAPGTGAYGFVTSAKGRILADLTVLALEDRLILELPPGRGEEIVDHLRRYIIVDRVEINRRQDLHPFTLLGPTAPQVLVTLGTTGELEVHGNQWLTSTETRSETRTETKIETALLLTRGADLFTPVWTLWASKEKAATIFRQVLEAGRKAGVIPVGHQAVERLRVEAGRPLFDRDFGPAFFPKETGIEPEAVSFTKGCYLGQEVVARIHYRGGVNRHLRGLLFASDAPPALELTGCAVMVDGREVGTVTSAIDGERGALGLAILHKRAQPGAEVEVQVDGGAKAQVVELPFTEES